MTLYLKSILLLSITFLSCSCNGNTNQSESSNDAEESSSLEAKTDFIINDHEYVDLGLPSGTKWATCNLGATSPEEFGDYYAWGEIKPKSSYTEANCPTYKKSFGWLITNDYVDEYGNLTMEHDAARQNWGGTWRMPTLREIKELESNTFYEWTQRDGVNGCVVRSKRNGKSIFLPACGWRDNKAEHEDDETKGIYWGATANTKKARTASGLYFYSTAFHSDWRMRCRGFVIRPVSQ